MEKNNRRQTLLLTVLGVFIVATIVVLWWSRRPIAPLDLTGAPPKKERKLPDTLLSDPRFQALRERGGTVDIGQKGNPNPFEPFK